jgi:alpha-L-arabinofuranosidase
MFVNLLVVLSAVGAFASYPPIGTRVSITPLSNLALGVRHCDYVCSASPAESGNDDFHFDVAAPSNGDSSQGMVSLRSANFPDHLLSPDSQGFVGVNTNPNADDATWQLVPGLTDPTNWTLISQSKKFSGYVMSLGRTSTNPCHDGNDIIIAQSGSGNVDTQTWVVGAPPPPPPPPPTSVTVSAGTITSILSSNILGVHSDEGFMHQPQFFLSQMVYGEAFETTNGMRSGWSTILDGTAQGSATLDSSNPFAAANRPSMRVSFSSGTGAVRFVHRGMGNEGLVFKGGNDYEGYFFAKASSSTTMTVALRDYVNGIVLNSKVVNVPGGSAWTQIFYDLTPTGSTDCEGIQSDPNIDCNNPFPDYVCIKCAGELSFELTNPGSTVWIGYARLEPGAWGRFNGLPIRIEAAETLQSMGVTAIRYGGSVGSSVSWKDFRGPVWNRTGLGRTWASCDMSGWGPFDAMDFFEAANISVAVTMSMTVPADYLADLVEYCLGDSTTTWGAQRIADGHPGLYQPFAFEIGNEQYNPNFVQQVKAMEDRATALLGKPPAWYYMFPDNDGLNSADQAAAVAAGLPISRIATDVHVGSSGGIQQISSVFDKSPSFQASAINGEVNAIYGDGVNTASALGRALSEATDLNTWFNADASVLSRIIARTASFASERNGHDDGSQWHQGLSFFLPNMTWLGPAGQLHAIVANTWASGALSVSLSPAAGPVSASAQKDQATGRLVVRLVNNNANAALVILTLTDFTLTSTTVKVTTLSGTALTQTNTPAEPFAISPVISNMTLGNTGGNVTLPALSSVTLEMMGN